MKLIVGLGNPRRIYIKNRHNIGFTCASYFARKHSIRFDKKQSRARIGTGEVADNGVVVARPQTYMNHSGDSVSRLVERYNISHTDIIVIHDDLDLPPGKIRVRSGGTSGGHKGIQSIISSLGTQDFIRIKIGIGRPASVFGSDKADEDEIVAYVLSDFTVDEKPVIDRAVHQVNEVILSLLNDGLAATMNMYN